MDLNREIPLSFGMLLAQNTEALRAFGRMSLTQRQSIIDGAWQIHNRQDMERYVSRLTDTAPLG